MQAYIGSVWAFGFNFPPLGWSLCNGAIMSISQNEALFALLGTTYGGDGVSTFALPNLQGRVPIGIGQGPGLSNFVIGQQGGSETVSLTAGNLPAHTHPVLSASLQVSDKAGSLSDPNNNYLAGSDATIANVYNTTPTAGITMAAIPPVNSGVTGNGIPVSILNTYQAVNYCICVEGIFPSRS